MIYIFPLYPHSGASSRVRFWQFLPSMNGSEDLVVCPLLSESYLKRLYSPGIKQRNYFDIFWSYICRFIWILRISRGDVVWIEKELFPNCPALAERWLRILGCKVVVDFDDAVYLRYKIGVFRFIGLTNKIEQVMKCADIVVAGNDVIADFARNVGANQVQVVPSVVDLYRYDIGLRECREEGIVKIGWIGTPITSGFLLPIEKVFAQLKLDRMEWVFYTMGAGAISDPKQRTEEFAWTEDAEIPFLHSIDIGIMPLDDSLFAEGKCGYKLIQYMAAGKPVVASPVGANCSIVEHGVNGFLASSVEEWIDCLETLICDSSLRARMGRAGRKKVEEVYSVGAQWPVLAKVLGRSDL